MALKIKLSRIGHKNNPKYRIVIAEAKSRRDGRYIDIVGFYDPLTDPATITVNKEKLTDWYKKGARPTEGTQHLLWKDYFSTL